MARHKDFEGANICEKAHFVDLLDYTIDLDAAWDEPDIQLTDSAP
jgi:hypothetical protein